MLNNLEIRKGYQRYSKYKSTNIDWLGDIPQEWNVRTLKRILHPVESGGREVGGGNQLDNGIFSIGGEHIGWLGELILDPPKYISNTYFQNLNSGQLKVNDILLVKDGATIGKLALIEKMPFEKCAINEHVFILRTKVNIHPKFVFFFLLCSCGQEQIKLEMRGAAQPGLPSGFTSLIYLSIPSIKEQEVIASFLNRKISKIDQLIEKKQRLVELLQEKRSALITNAVTKGLDPNAKMKDSGVEWLGPIPRHWQVKKLKYVVMEALSNGLFKTKQYYGAGVKLVNVFDIYRDNFLIDYETLDCIEADAYEISKYRVQDGDIFFVRSSLKIEGVGHSACATNVLEPLVFECHLIRVRPNEKSVSSLFLIHFLNSVYTINRLIAIANVVTMATIDQSNFKNLEIAVPPISEQKNITTYLNTKCQKTDIIITKIESQIEKLKEYRIALVSEAVTGKIKV